MITDVTKCISRPDDPTSAPPDYNANPMTSADRAWESPATPMPWSGSKTVKGTCIKIRNAVLYANITDWNPMNVANSNTDISVGDNTEVWLTITVKDDLTVTSAQIGTVGPSEIITWTIADDISPAIQTQAAVLIGEIKDGRWHQYLTTNLFATIITVDGKAALFPLAFAG